MRHLQKSSSAAWVRTRIALAAASAGLLLAGAASVQAADSGLPQQIVVQLRGSDSLPGVLSSYGLTLSRQLGPRPFYLLRTVAADDLAAKIAALNADARVAFAEPNLRLRDPEARKRSVWAIGRQSDNLDQWAPQQLWLAAAHAVSDGSGVTVAVDTGVDYNHPDLAANIFTNAAEAAGVAGVDDDGNGYIDDLHDWAIHLRNLQE